MRRVFYILSYVMMIVSLLNCDMSGWKQYDFEARDIAMSSEGIIYAISLDYKLHLFDWNSEKFKEVESYNIQLNNIKKVVSDTEGTPWVITTNNEIYYLNCNNNWIKIPGCARDIAIGKGFDMWLIGCDDHEDAYGIWKLNCDNILEYDNSIYLNCERNCYRYKQSYYKTRFFNEENKVCEWIRLNGSGIKITVDEEGNPYIIKNDFTIWKYDIKKPQAMSSLLPGLYANEIQISNENILFAIGTDNSIKRLACGKLGTWSVLYGQAKKLAVGPFSQIYVIGIDKKIYSSY